MDLVIKNVPEEKAVIQEIISNAETTIRNYHDKLIRTIPVEKELEFEAVMTSFRGANKIVEEVEVPVEGIVNGEKD